MAIKTNLKAQAIYKTFLKYIIDATSVMIVLVSSDVTHMMRVTQFVGVIKQNIKSLMLS